MKDESSPPPSPKKRGRPRVEERRAVVSTWLEVRDADRLTRFAHQRGESVSAAMRRLVVQRLRGE